MNRQLEQVAEFHETFDQPILETPTIISDKRFQFRVSLIAEELKELTDAFENGDKVEVLDALGDLNYVMNGLILELGFKDVFDTAFNRIHDSNMSKVCQNKQEMKETLRKYEYDGVRVYSKPKGDKYLVYRESDDKVLKNINYHAVDLADLV